MSVRGYAIDWHGRCPYCGVTLTDSDHEKITQRSKDHIVPQRVGGTVRRNLVYSCLACNRDKHHLTLFEWRVVRLLRLQSPFLAWDVDIPAILWREFKNFLLTSTEVTRQGYRKTVIEHGN